MNTDKLKSKIAGHYFDRWSARSTEKITEEALEVLRADSELFADTVVKEVLNELNSHLGYHKLQTLIRGSLTNSITTHGEITFKSADSAARRLTGQIWGVIKGVLRNS